MSHENSLIATYQSHALPELIKVRAYVFLVPVILFLSIGLGCLLGIYHYYCFKPAEIVSIFGIPSWLYFYSLLILPIGWEINSYICKKTIKRAKSFELKLYKNYLQIKNLKAKVITIPYQKIQSISPRTSIFQKKYQVGSIKIESTIYEFNPLLLGDFKNYNEVIQQLNELMKNQN